MFRAGSARISDAQRLFTGPLHKQNKKRGPCPGDFLDRGLAVSLEQDSSASPDAGSHSQHTAIFMSYYHRGAPETAMAKQLRFKHMLHILHRMADRMHGAVCIPAQMAVLLHHLAAVRRHRNTGDNTRADSFDKAHRFLIHHIRPPNCIRFFQQFDQGVAPH